MVGLQSGNEHGRNNIVHTVLNHGHLVLKTANVAFESLSWLHLDGEEMVLFFLNSCHEVYLLKKASLTSSKLQRECDERK